MCVRQSSACFSPPYRSNLQNQRPHTWEEHTYKPSSTFCDQCGAIMYGLDKQGVKCSGEQDVSGSRNREHLYSLAERTPAAKNSLATFALLLLLPPHIDFQSYARCTLLH